MSEPLDVVVVGAGAAGLAAGVFAARLKPGLRVAILDGAPKVGAKLLISRGARCNAAHDRVDGAAGDLDARRVVLATGGLSLPKTGSDGLGYKIAASLGHTMVPTTPGLEPLQLEGDFHVGLSGIAIPVEILVRVAGRKPARLEG